MLFRSTLFAFVTALAFIAMTLPATLSTPISLNSRPSLGWTTLTRFHSLALVPRQQ